MTRLLDWIFVGLLETLLGFLYCFAQKSFEHLLQKIFIKNNDMELMCFFLCFLSELAY